MAKFLKNWTYLTPLRTMEFATGNETIDNDVIAAANIAGVLQLEDDANASDRPSKRSKASSTINLEG